MKKILSFLFYKQSLSFREIKGKNGPISITRKSLLFQILWRHTIRMKISVFLKTILSNLDRRMCGSVFRYALMEYSVPVWFSFFIISNLFAQSTVSWEKFLTAGNWLGFPESNILSWKLLYCITRFFCFLNRNSQYTNIWNQHNIVY